MTGNKFISDDPFWDIKNQEKIARADFDNDIRDLEGAIGIAEKAIALQRSPGWPEFVKALEVQLENRKDELMLADTPIAATLLQGRCREIRSILGLMRKAELSIEQLNERLAYRVEERDKRFSGGVVKPVGAV